MLVGEEFPIPRKPLWDGIVKFKGHKHERAAEARFVSCRMLRAITDEEWSYLCAMAHCCTSTGVVFL